jgi:hypothetical protein
MLDAMRLLVMVMLLVPSIAMATPRDDVEALPEIATVKKGRVTVVVRGAIAKAKHREMIQLVEQVINYTSARFGIAKGDPHPAVTLCLFSDAASYNKVAGAFGYHIQAMMHPIDEIDVGMSGRAEHDFSTPGKSFG